MPDPRWTKERTAWEVGPGGPYLGLERRWVRDILWDHGRAVWWGKRGPDRIQVPLQGPNGEVPITVWSGIENQWTLEEKPRWWDLRVAECRPPAGQPAGGVDGGDDAGEGPWE